MGDGAPDSDEEKGVDGDPSENGEDSLLSTEPVPAEKSGEAPDEDGDQRGEQRGVTWLDFDRDLPNEDGKDSVGGKGNFASLETNGNKAKSRLEGMHPICTLSGQRDGL
jgi:hypothetical protein